MKKFFLLTLTVLLTWSTNAEANPVSKSEALQKAAAFLQERGKMVSGSLNMAEGPRKAKANSMATPSYYVVNNGEDDGFVIVAGDDRAKPVLAYADNGHFDEENMPEMVANMLNGYVEEMELKGNSLPEDVTERAKTKTPTTNPIYPMVTTKWAQTDPFNIKCPVVPNTDTKCFVGCVAVAMAQLIYYYRDRMNSKLSVAIPGYTCTTSWSGKKIAVSGVAAGTAINWSNMYEEDNGKQTSTQKTNLANFLLYCATALESEFRGGDDKITTAPISNIYTSLVKYFNFKSNYVKTFARSSYNYAKWKDMIVNELEQGRPVLYYAGSKQDAGHVFVIDGFDGGDLFHINWGWGGRYNGYFSLTTFDPFDYGGDDSNVTTSSYVSNQQVFLDLQPAKGYNNTDVSHNLTATLNKATTASGTVTYANNTSNTGNYFFGLGYYDDNGQFKLAKQASTTAKEMASGATAVVTYNLSISDFGVSKTTKKTFKVFPVCKLKGEEDWMTCEQPSTVYYFSAVCNGSVTLTIEKDYANIAATKFVFPGTNVKGTKQPVVVTVTNTGGDFFGTIYLFASTTTTMGSAKSYYQMYIPSGKTVNLELNFTPDQAGTYNIWVAAGSAGTPLLGKSTVTIVKSSATRDLSVSSFSLQNVKSGNVVYGKNLRGTAVIKNNSSLVYHDKVFTQLYVYSGSSWSSTDTKIETNVHINSKGTVSLDFAFDDLNPSISYAVVFKYADNKYLSSNFIFRHCKVTNAVMCYKADGKLVGIEPASTVTIANDIAAVDLTGLTSTVTKVVTNSNPNTLYFIGASDKVITGLSGKNVVKGTVAEKVALTDGYDFYTPKDITAQTITYTRTSSLGTSGKNGWQTLVLPFAPTKVTCNGNELDWFKYGKDSNKNFWLKDFCAIEGASKVLFGYVQEMEANHPYLFAVPGSNWGETNNLVGKPVVFTGQNAVLYESPLVMTGSDVYNFRGTYMKQTVANSWILDKTGAKFVFGSNTVMPFHCYFIATDKDLIDVNSLNIGSFEEDDADGIFMPFAAENEMVDVYDLSGVKVGRVEVVNAKVNIDNLPKGIYVIKGKKMVKY